MHAWSDAHGLGYVAMLTRCMADWDICSGGRTYLNGARNVKFREDSASAEPSRVSASMEYPRAANAWCRPCCTYDEKIALLTTPGGTTGHGVGLRKKGSGSRRCTSYAGPAAAGSPAAGHIVSMSCRTKK
eukprot:353822-Chlamydomonas_euryale.AAC.8